MDQSMIASIDRPIDQSMNPTIDWLIIQQVQTWLRDISATPLDSPLQSADTVDIGVKVNVAVDIRSIDRTMDWSRTPKSTLPER